MIINIPVGTHLNLSLLTLFPQLPHGRSCFCFDLVSDIVQNIDGLFSFEKHLSSTCMPDMCTNSPVLREFLCKFVGSFSLTSPYPWGQMVPAYSPGDTENKILWVQYVRHDLQLNWTWVKKVVLKGQRGKSDSPVWRSPCAAWDFLRLWQRTGDIGTQPPKYSSCCTSHQLPHHVPRTLMAPAATSADVFSCRYWGTVLLAPSGGWGPGMWLHVLQCTGQPPQQRITQPACP